MVQKSTRRADQYNTTFSKPCFFFLGCFTTHNNCTDHVVKKLQKSFEFDVDLDCKLSCWGEDDCHRSTFSSVNLLFCQTVPAQIFNQRNQVSKCLSRTCFTLQNCILMGQDVWNTLSLYVCKLFETTFSQNLLKFIANIKFIELYKIWCLIYFLFKYPAYN